MRNVSLAPVLAAFVLVAACHDSPTTPGPVTLADGRWTGDVACLAVTSTECNLAVGCGHGVFLKPDIRADGSFDVDGTYRIEAGPVSIDPAPPAHYSGTLSRGRLTLRVVPSGSSLPPALYLMTPAAAGKCPVPCL